MKGIGRFVIVSHGSPRFTVRLCHWKLPLEQVPRLVLTSHGAEVAAQLRKAAVGLPASNKWFLALVSSG